MTVDVTVDGVEVSSTERRQHDHVPPSSLGHTVSTMHVAALEMELHIGASDSLKAKRAVVRHLVETARRRFGVSASEVAYHDLWQRAALGFSTVAPNAKHAEEILDQVERFVWSHPEVTVTSSVRHWLDLDP